MENSKPFALSELEKLKTKYFPFLKEVRKRLLNAVYVFIGFTLLGFIFYEEIIKFLINFLSLREINIVFTSPFQFINLSMSCGIATGLVVAFPFLIKQILIFLKPALGKKEYRKITRFIPFCFILFLVGFFFGGWVMKWQIEASLIRSVSLGIGNILDISKLLSAILLTSALMGVCFQFPIVLLILMHIGVIEPKTLRKKRLWIYLGTFLFTMLFPVDSVLTDLLLTLPLIILFEITLFLNWIWGGKKKNRK